MLRHVARLAMIASLALFSTGFLASRPTQAAPGIGIYKSAAFHYSFSYPATWTVQHPQGTDVDVSAPGRFAGFLALVKPGAVSAAVLKADLKSLLLSLGPVKSTPTYAVATTNGVSYSVWSATFSAANAKTNHAVTFGAVHGKFVYFFAAGVDLGLPSTQANRTALNALMASLTLN